MQKILKDNSAYAWYVAALLSLTHLVSFLDRFVMSLLLVPVKEAFELNDTQLGLLHGLGLVILYVVVAVPLGRLADVSNRRNIIICGIIFWSLATAACGLANSFEMLFAARVGVGLGEASLVPAAMSLLAAYFAREALGRAVASFTMGASIGMSVAFIGGGAVLAILTASGGLQVPGVGTFAPWRALFILTSIPGFVLAALLLTVREPVRAPHASATKPGVGAALSYILEHRQAFFWHTAASVSVIILAQSFIAWVPTFYARLFDYTPAEAGVMIGIVMLVAMPLGNMTGGFLMDEFHRRGIASPPGLVIFLMLLMVIPSALVFCRASAISVSITSFGLLMYFLTAAAPAGLAGIQMITPDRLRGVVSSLFLAAITLLAVGFGPVMVGMLTDFVFANEKAVSVSLLAMTLCMGTLGVVTSLISRSSTKLPIERVASGAA